MSKDKEVKSTYSIDESEGLDLFGAVVLEFMRARVNADRSNKLIQEAGAEQYARESVRLARALFAELENEKGR